MVEGLPELLPAAHVGHIGLCRNPDTLEPEEYYSNIPEDISDRVVLVLDPMLATGSKVIDGKDEVILNQDGIDLRIGCHHIDIEDISGRTGDDMVALTGIGITDTANIRQPGDVMDESTEEFTAYATLKIGDKNPHRGSTNPPADTAFITVRNLRSNSRVGVQIQNALSDSRFSGITRGKFCDDMLKIIDLNLLKNVEFDTFSIK